MGFPGGASGKEPACQCRRCKRRGFDPWVRKEWLPTPVFLPGESHGQRSLAGYSPQGCKELDMTEVTEHARRHAYQYLTYFPILLTLTQPSACLLFYFVHFGH